MYSHTYEVHVQIHHGVQLHLRGTAAPARYSCTYEVKRHIPGTPYETAAPMRYSCTYEVQLPTRYSSAPTRYSYTYEVQLHLRGTATPGTPTPTLERRLK
jgi:hypothetical protein